MPSVCNAVGLLILCKLCPVFTFFQQLMTKDFEILTHTLVLQCSPSRSSRQPHLPHAFAVSRISLLCNALHICVAHAPTESFLFPCLYIEPLELVVNIIFHYCTTPACHKINLFKHPSWLWGSRFGCLEDSFVLIASSSFTFRKSSFLSDDRLNSRMYSVR